MSVNVDPLARARLLELFGPVGLDVMLGEWERIEVMGDGAVMEALARAWKSRLTRFPLDALLFWNAEMRAEESGEGEAFHRALAVLGSEPSGMVGA